MVAALSIGLATELSATRARSLGTALAILLVVAAAGVIGTTLAWPGRAALWRGHRRGLAAAVGLLALMTGLCAAVEAFLIGWHVTM